MKNIRRSLYAFIFYSGLIYFFRMLFRRRFNSPVQIFYTHRVIDSDDQLYDFLKLLGFPTVEDYERKIAYLSRHYTIASLPNTLDALKKGQQAPNTVVLTFDDGYRCIYTRLFPLLKKYRVPVTVFLSTDMLQRRLLPWHDRLMYIIGKTRKDELRLPELPQGSFQLRTLRDKKVALRSISHELKLLDNDRKEALTSRLARELGVGGEELNDPELFLTWEHVKEMEESGLVSFASHTLSHPILSRVSGEQARREIVESRKILEEKLRHPVTLFAYPNGRERDFTPETIEFLKEAGYEAALTTIGGSNNPCFDPYRIGRHGLMDDPLCITALICSGFFELLKPVRCVVKHGLFDRLREKNLSSWLPQYAVDIITRRYNRTSRAPKHIMFCLVDHFETQHGNASDTQARARIDSWMQGYPRALGLFRDADGFRPQHSWFYPPHHDLRYLDDLVSLCRQGYGEIEMHLHHNRMPPFPDTEKTLRDKIKRCVDDYAARGGIFCLPDGSKTFAFIHGDWSLDNARGNEFCGINNELDILRDCGCYADYTFPSLGTAQPAMINRMYYAADDPRKPKSYNRGHEVRANAGPGAARGLMMISGILGTRSGRGQAGLGWVVETSNLDASEPPTKQRVDYWVRNAVRLLNKPDWLFIKLHTHGAVEENFDALFGKQAASAYEYLTTRYNDKKEYYLHFVSARQMYNIVKAAEAGKAGDPGQYRNFAIPPYVYLPGK